MSVQCLARVAFDGILQGVANENPHPRHVSCLDHAYYYCLATAKKAWLLKRSIVRFAQTPALKSSSPHSVRKWEERPDTHTHRVSILTGHPYPQQKQSLHPCPEQRGVYVPRYRAAGRKYTHVPGAASTLAVPASTRLIDGLFCSRAAA